MALQKVTTQATEATAPVSQILDDEDHSQEGVIAALRRQYRAEELHSFKVEPFEPEAEKPAPKRAAKPATA